MSRRALVVALAVVASTAVRADEFDRYVNATLAKAAESGDAREQKRIGSKEILENFPDGQVIRQVAEGKRPMPNDAVRRSIYQVQVARLEEKQEKDKKEQKVAYNPAHPLAAPAPRHHPQP